MEERSKTMWKISVFDISHEGSAKLRKETTTKGVTVQDAIASLGLPTEWDLEKINPRRHNEVGAKLCNLFRMEVGETKAGGLFRWHSLLVCSFERKARS